MKYSNPLYEHEFPDPFVFKYCGEYWAISTGYWHDGGVFGMRHSRDLVNWKDAGSALNPPPFDAPCYWAPEIFYDNGKFYLYYSVGNEEFMEIRVAVADSPNGKYTDSGYKLTTEQFAIDAHVFVDEDDSRWLFYATDFLTHSHIGTGTVRDRLISPFQLEGKPQPVSRARFDWQVYDPRRESKGNVRWHTVEGSFVLKRKGIYYQMFSGGNWQNPTYGVSFSKTRNLLAPEEWEQHSDGERILPILRTIPGKVIGPGHNSVVRAPDNFGLYCVYHRWSEDLRGRLPAIDPLDFAGERILILGASTTPQPAPNQPTAFDYFDKNRESGLGDLWICDEEENWLVNSGAAISNALAEKTEAACRARADAFLVEVSAKSISFSGKESGYGFCLKDKDRLLLQCLILPLTKQIEIREPGKSRTFDLPTDFNPQAFHLWRVEVDNHFFRIKLDEAAFRFEKFVETAPKEFSLSSVKMSAAFSGFSFTVGFENLFEGENIFPSQLGWQLKKGSPESWKIENGCLKHAPFGSQESVLVKSIPFESFEFVSNIRMKAALAPARGSGFYLKQSDSAIFLSIRRDENEDAYLLAQSERETRRFDLPAFFAHDEFNQFRFRRENEKLRLYWESTELGEIAIKPGAIVAGLYSQNQEVEFEMVRAVMLRAF